MVRAPGKKPPALLETRRGADGGKGAAGRTKNRRCNTGAGLTMGTSCFYAAGSRNFLERGRCNRKTLVEARRPEARDGARTYVRLPGGGTRPPESTSALFGKEWDGPCWTGIRGLRPGAQQA